MAPHNDCLCPIWPLKTSQSISAFSVFSKGRSPDRWLCLFSVSALTQKKETLEYPGIVLATNLFTSGIDLLASISFFLATFKSNMPPSHVSFCFVYLLKIALNSPIAVSVLICPFKDYKNFPVFLYHLKTLLQRYMAVSVLFSHSYSKVEKVCQCFRTSLAKISWS